MRERCQLLGGELDAGPLPGGGFEATNGAEAVEQARAIRPDVVLMDIRMPKLDGIQATTRIAQTPGLERVRVLILTTYDTDAYVFDALQAGASGFLLKDAGPRATSRSLDVTSCDRK